jgi:hypothetical protein
MKRLVVGLNLKLLDLYLQHDKTGGLEGLTSGLDIEIQDLCALGIRILVRACKIPPCIQLSVVDAEKGLFHIDRTYLWKEVRVSCLSRRD